MRTNLPPEAKWIAGVSVAVVVAALVMLAVAGSPAGAAVAAWAERIGLSERVQP
jgi:hypothetical protein